MSDDYGFDDSFFLSDSGPMDSLVGGPSESLLQTDPGPLPEMPAPNPFLDHDHGPRFGAGFPINPDLKQPVPVLVSPENLDELAETGIPLHVNVLEGQDITPKPLSTDLIREILREED